MQNLIVLTPLVRWFQTNKRSLPWRENPSPYAVWISEIMLQQTQVITVIPYFEKWMRLFPTIHDLAAAHEDTIIKAWEGLGYYSRARRLHQGAKICVEKFKGDLPSNPSDLEEIKGIGPYTKGAILSFAFHQRAAAVDGNVLRVMSRLLGSEKDITLPATRKHIEAVVYQTLPQESPWQAMEALIELGALLCSKKPLCASCPLRSQCTAFKEGTTTLLPIKKKRAETIRLLRHALFVTSNEHILLSKGKADKVMADLWELPYFENALPQKAWGIDLSVAEPLGKVKYGFTKYQVDLHGWNLPVTTLFECKEAEWMPLSLLHTLPFSSGMRKLFALKAL